MFTWIERQKIIIWILVYVFGFTRKYLLVPKLKLHSTNQYIVDCYFHLKGNTLSKRHHYWDGQSMAEAAPWGCLFWRETTVASKLNIPLWFPFSGVYWRCLWPRWLGQLDSLDTEGVHPDCWVRAFCLATPSPPPPPPTSPLTYPLEFARRMIC